MAIIREIPIFLSWLYSKKFHILAIAAVFIIYNLGMILYYFDVFREVGEIPIPIEITGDPQVRIGITEEHFVQLGRNLEGRIPQSESGFMYREQKDKYVFEYLFNSHWGEIVLFDFYLRMNNDIIPTDSLPIIYLSTCRKLFQHLQNTLGSTYSVEYSKFAPFQVSIIWRYQNASVYLDTPFNRSGGIIVENASATFQTFSFYDPIFYIRSDSDDKGNYLSCSSQEKQTLKILLQEK